MSARHPGGQWVNGCVNPADPHDIGDCGNDPSTYADDGVDITATTPGEAMPKTALPPMPWGRRQPTAAELHRYLALHPRNVDVTRWFARRFGLDAA